MGGARQRQLVDIQIDRIKLEGELVGSSGVKGIVIFAHGSGSSRHSPRNKFVAEELQKVGIGTLLFDLLTEKEDEIYETRFNIELSTDRLVAATKWLKNQQQAKGFKIGYFGASTGAAAALAAAATLGSEISAVVSRGGRPDLALSILDKVVAATLLIVGEGDELVVGLNEKAYRELKAEKGLEIVPGATHLFEEPGALERVAFLAADWFKKYLPS